MSSLAEQKAILDRMHVDDCHAVSEEDVKTLTAIADSFRDAGDLADEQRARGLLGSIESNRGQFDAAISDLKRAVALSEMRKDDRSELDYLADLADALNHDGNSKDGLIYIETALRKAQHPGDKAAEAAAERLYGEIISASNVNEANRRLRRALALSEEAHDLKNKAIVLYDQGDLWSDPKDPDGAIRLFDAALKIEEQIGDCRDKAETLADLGTVEEERGNARRAIDATTEALQLERQLSDRDSEAKTVHVLAKIHEDLGDLPEALTLFEEALKIEQEIGDTSAEGPTLVSINGVHQEMGEHKEALQGFQETLAFLESENDQQSQVKALNNLGAVQAALGDRDGAKKSYEASNDMARKASDQVFPAFNAWGIGELEGSDALKHYLKALELAQEFDQFELQGLVSASLMDHYKAQHLPEVAIFLGKMAVDKFQQLRKNMGGLSDALTSSFVERKAQTYRTLAALLIDTGRLKEAQQVLDLLKIQQYSDYMGGRSDSPRLALSRLPIEKQIEVELNLRLSHAVALRKKIDASRASSGQPGVTQEQAELGMSEDKLVEFAGEAERRLRPSAIRELRPDEETGPQATLDQLIARNPKTAALYTLVEADRYRIFVITNRGRFAGFMPVSQDELKRKCGAFLDQLRGHRVDPTAAAQDLFGIVFGPVQKEVEKAGATTLVWYLDSALRYVPIGALTDPASGRFLIEDYNIVNYTPLARFQGDRPNLAGATGIAMGTSKQFDPDLPELENVPAELDRVIKDPRVEGSDGPLPGRILLNDAFTEEAMKQELKSQTVVHFASHFVLVPGNDSLSYLLLGGKEESGKAHHLSLAEFKEDRSYRLDGTELVTLSACETGAENRRDDGVVMEGMSEAVLDKKAKAVISSLWSVNDESTGAIMSRFYELWIGSRGKTTKAEALRQAQLELIEGHVSSQSKANNRGLHPTDSTERPEFADPYYWAPFVLVGNWQ
jgi:CHAT domain-containing protein/tetratricopeptide (TPR) repeat protein